MTHSIEWLRLFVLHYPSFQYIIIFLVTMIGGELALFTLGFLAAQGILPILSLIVFGFLGAFSPNILWFLLGRTTAVSRIISYRYANTTISVITEAVERVSQGNHLVALIIAKFLFGTPIILTLYLNKAILGFRQFIYYESIAIALSLSIIIPIGFISGLGFNYLAGIFHNLYVALGFVLLVIIVIIMVQLRFEKLFIRTH